MPWKIYCTDEKNLDWKLEKVGNKNYNVEIGTGNIKINVNMDLEGFKTKMNEHLDERAFDEFFIAIKQCSFSYSKPIYAKLKEEYADGEKSTQFVKRLKVFVSDFKL